MSKSIITKAELIADFLRGLELDANVSFSPEYNLSNGTSKKGTTVFVSPRDKKSTRESRQIVNTEYVIDIGILERAREEDNVTPLIELAESLADELLNKTFDNAMVFQVTFNPLFASEELRQKHLFVSVLSLTLKEIL